MGVLDADRVRAALGVRLADKFLQYTHPPDAGEAGRLLIRIDEHVAAVRGEGELAARIAIACKRLLMRAEGAPPEAVMAIVGAARYFVDTYDLVRDDGPLGYADDAEVVDYVIANVAPDLPRVGSWPARA